MTRGNERDEPTQETVEALYDAFAPVLYRYAWSLLGEGPGVADAVHDGLVAARTLGERPADPAERGPWLYALVRAAARRRGFAHACPYTRLATVPAEQPVARMFSRLPASHRELVELHLRHALPASAIARILGLDPELCVELARSAVRRAADGLAEARDPEHAARARARIPEDEGPISATGWRARMEEVSTALALLRPPGPPPSLRERIVKSCTDPELADERRRVAREMHPLTSEGYPLHRSRAAETTDTAVETGPADDEQGAPRPTRFLPGDRLHTADHPVREEPRAPLPGPEGAAEDEDLPRRHSRRTLPVIAGLATATLAVALWSWAGAVEGPTTVIGTGPEETGDGPPALVQVETASTAADTRPEADATTGVSDTPASPEEGEPTEAPGDGAQTSPDPRAPGENTTPPDREDPPAGEAPPQQPSVEPSGNDDAPDEEPDDGSDHGGGLLSGLLGLLLGGG
ncbi:RNA polymerase sigma factor [Nocardiopsis lambiniae]|uniref:Sigma-70 family RNA polymerase sigma factor n=1 Tax=Nocardiopsis lambiniae TaxID=3075539 RepID=A0ABU2MEL0_9ACTN|nr:sigma-70 family RNA polymerase sigma factor [Nocardiopsis sp. DSM 44743]MDT0331124.1 sigma-70 family RNA polymerase sigma factor [Nocardiopsis sp. DSM 44743]